MTSKKEKTKKQTKQELIEAISQDYENGDISREEFREKINDIGGEEAERVLENEEETFNDNSKKSEIKTTEVEVIRDNTQQVSGTVITRQPWTKDQLDLIKTTVAKNTTDDQLKLFLYTAKKTGLDPLTKQIYCVVRNVKNKQTGKYEPQMSIQTGIDGFRVIASRTGEYEGQTKVEWCGEDEVWKDIWVSKKNPVAARVGVYRKGFREPLYATAKFDSYVQKDKEGQITTFWTKMGELMIAKVAEALALRKAFPQDLSGIYTTEEMMQAENTSIEVIPIGESKQQTDTPVLQNPIFTQIAPIIDNPGKISVVRDGPISEPQMKFIQKLSEIIGDDDRSRLHAYIAKKFNKESTKDLTKAEASHVIEKLKGISESPKGEEVPSVDYENNEKIKETVEY